MKPQLDEKIISQLIDNVAFQAFCVWMEDQIDLLDTTVGLEKLDNQAAGEEAKIRRATAVRLMHILQPVHNFKKKIEAEQKKKKRLKNMYGAE